ncbi:hypothetical protein EV421DRAFT_1740291 [Armillaria borealis]|uniref:Uncharacterized protein n=1 Tax=Armillaria borealis TaxID=47425 RepID=A0AA39J4Q9_9AGAR|nr:hypothetical protein EV421DRAFT_1740291 [Armillaria borealis]
MPYTYSPSESPSESDISNCSLSYSPNILPARQNLDFHPLYTGMPTPTAQPLPAIRSQLPISAFHLSTPTAMHTHRPVGSTYNNTLVSPSPHLSLSDPVTPPSNGTTLDIADNSSQVLRTLLAAPIPVLARSSGTVVQHEFVSNLAQKFKLNERFMANLHLFNKLGSNPEALLSKADLSTHLYMLGSMYHLHTLSHHDTSEGEMNTSPEIKGMLTQVVEHIQDGPWEVNKTLMTSVRSLCQEFLYNPQRTNYKDLWKDIMAHLCKYQDKYKLTKVFGNAAHEQKLTTAVRRQSSHARSTMRTDVINSIGSSKFLTLLEFTAATARNSGKDSDGAADSDSSDDDQLDGPARKHARAADGKAVATSHGNDFWALMQAYLGQEIARHGKSFDTSL